MIRTILSHDIEAGTARIRFEHEGVVIEEDYSLIHLVPGTAYVLEAMQMPFDEEKQFAAIDYLERMLAQQIDGGTLKPAPEPVSEAELPEEEPSAPEGE